MGRRRSFSLPLCCLFVPLLLFYRLLSQTRVHGSAFAADFDSFSALLTAHALPLLDLSLYVSSENYSTATRPAYASLLPFPASWIIPTKRRTLAKQRSAHLGLSSLDLDTASPSDTATPPSASFLQIPKSLRTPKTSVAAAVKSPETASRIRLEVLAQTVLDPLAALLDERPHDERVGAKDSHGAYFFSATAPCSLDCLVLGYLALFLVPDIPHPFLATTLKKYPALTTYVRRGIQKFFFFPTHVPAPESLALGNNDLSSSTSTSKANVVGTEHPGSDPVGFPWRDPLPPSALSGVGLVLHESAASIPLLGPLLQNGSIRHASTSATATANNQPTSETVYLKTFVPAIGALWVGVTAVAAVVGAVMLSEKASVGHDQGWGGGWGHAGGDRVVGSAEAGTRGLSEMGDTGDALLAGLWVGRAARERGGQRQMPAGEGGEVEV